MIYHKIPEEFSRPAIELLLDIQALNQEQGNQLNEQVIAWKDEKIAELERCLSRAYAHVDILEQRFVQFVRVSSDEIDNYVERVYKP